MSARAADKGVSAHCGASVARNARRGQIWSIDVTTAAVMLSFILLFSILLWNGMAMRWNASSGYREMQTDALFAADALMATSGQPEGWEMLPGMEGVDSIGLVNGRNELNEMKIRKLVSENGTSYEFVKEKLGVQRYELGIRVSSLDADEEYHEFGMFSTGLEDAVVLERMGIINGSPVMVRVEVWK